MTKIIADNENIEPFIIDAGQARSLLETIIGKEKTGEMLAFFHATSNGLSCRYYNNLKRVNPYRGADAQRESPIVFGTLSSLAFYEATGYPREPFKQHSVSMFFLDKYLLIPTRSGKLVFVCDDHKHALFAWMLAQRSRIVNNPALIHIDQHYDYQPGSVTEKRIQLTLKGAAKFVQEKMRINNFVSAALSLDIAGGHVIDPHGVFFVTSENTGCGIYRPVTFGPRNGIFEMKDVSLELAGEALDKTRRSGGSVICDIDLDFFLPFINNTKKTGLSYEEVIQKVADIASHSDFITIATSPNYTATPDHREIVRYLLKRIIERLN
jgi:hypothetical protein